MPEVIRAVSDGWPADRHWRRRVGVPFGWLVRVCAEDTELSSVEGQGTTASATDLSDRQTARGRG